MPKKGRKGNDQRVKGNAKTASSGRMVELLGGEMGAGVIGFETVSSGLLQRGAGGGNRSSEGAVGGGGGVGGGGEDVSLYGAGTKFQVVMKQLGKKDTTTKLKALQEFATLCAEEPPEAVKAILHVWVLMYNKLSMDNDNRVREASHKALKACATAVKNGLAPHLRSIVGCWVSGMEDPHRPSASAAMAAFNAAFSEAKKTEVLEYSFSTVVKRAGGVILKETPDTFSDPKIVSEDERVQRYERAVVMAVKSLTYIFLKLSDEFLDKNLDVFQQLLSDKKFWKLTKHQNPSIRAASYGVITALCEQLPFFIKDRAKVFCAAALGSLSDSDPVVVGPLWEAALMVIGKVKNWNEHVNVQKAILPGLWAVMDSGGHGCAKVIHPCFLPLLSHLVDKVYKRDSNFAKSFLLHLRQGLHGDRVRMSRVECEAVINAYAECFLFLATALDLNPSEQRSWFNEAATMLMELLEYGLMSSPLTQSEPIMAAFVRVISGIIQTAKKNKIMEPFLFDLQLKIAEKCSQVLDKEEDGCKISTYFERIGTLVKFFHTLPDKVKGERKKVVNFVVAAGGNKTLPSSSVGSNSVDERTVQVRNFIKPSICTLCGNCIAAVSRCQDTNYSHLLLTTVRLFISQDFVKSVFSSLDTNHHRILVKQKGSHPLRQKLLTVCSLLTKAAKLDSLSTDTATCTFTEDILESLVLLLNDRLVDSSSAVMLLSEVVKDCPPVLPLLLVKLLENNRQQEFQQLLNSCKSFMEGLLTNMSPENSIFLWKFLDVLFTTQSTSSSFYEKLVGQAFRSICQLLTDCFIASPQERQLCESSVKTLLSTLCKVPHSVMQSETDLHEEVSNLLGCLLHWCLQKLQTTDGEETYLSGVVDGYSHLLSGLPDLRKYLCSVSHLVLEESRTRSSCLSHTLFASVVFLLLHRSVLTTSETFWNLYEALLTATTSVETSFLPLSGLESFCRGDMVFSPLLADTSSSSSLLIPLTIPPSLLIALFPAIPFANLRHIETGLRATVSQSSVVGSSVSPSSASVEEVVKELSAWKSSHDDGADLVKTACGCHGESEVPPDAHSSVMKNWKLLTLSLCFAHGSLEDCQLTTRTPLEVKVRSLFLSAVEKCLSSVLEYHTSWLDFLVKYLVEKSSSSGPLWLLVIRQVFSTLNKIVREDSREVLEGLVRIIVQEQSSATLSSAVSYLNISSWSPQLEPLAEDTADPCLLRTFIHLFPEKEHLLSKAAKMLVEVASKQASSEITLFESLEESAQDPFTFSTLGLIQALVDKQMVPAEVWEFILCSLVSLIQLIADKEASCNVNQTVLVSHVFSLSHRVALFFNSPFPPSQQATEWAEFFQPALQDCLLPYFLKRAKLFSSQSNDPRLTYRHHGLCQSVSVLCSQPQNVSFEEAMAMVPSQFYPQQAAAFILAKRLLATMTIYVNDVPSSTLSEDKTPVKLSVLQELFGKALEAINMDLVFLEDSEHSFLPEATSMSALEHHTFYHNTTSYIFTWLLIIKAMGQCDPEARGALSEWMKELSLFDHLLHGLLKFITEPSKGPSELKVTFHPDLEQLVSLAFMEIACHLPSMLRQWYLSVDRQTSALVNRFTTKHISPALHQSELQSFGKSVTVHGNMEVRVYSGVSEISVVYKVDEFSIELFVHLPASYPLQPPGIREGKRIKIDLAQWRKWLLQFNIFVTNQNGSLMDGILLWKSNLDKHFSGVEDCMICFSVIHSSNYSLPKMVCRTCKKKFHSACLYKWFNTSTKSSCPLCRNIF